MKGRKMLHKLKKVWKESGATSPSQVNLRFVNTYPETYLSMSTICSGFGLLESYIDQPRKRKILFVCFGVVNVHVFPN